MCGICGDVDLAGPPAAEGVRRPARAIAPGGPEAEAFFFEGPAGLGHRRLAILDLESGDQPMVRDAVAVVFNGEAYDFASLREELGGKGHPFSSRSDTEVVLPAYLEWGEDFAEHVHGMFALAIWDSRRRKLVLARDRLGKKPLYYALRGSRVIFGSELKALLAHGGVARQLDHEALVQYLACEYVPAPGTILRGVRKLPAAHLAILDDRGFRLRRYWNVPGPSEQRVSPADAAGELLPPLHRAGAPGGGGAAGGRGRRAFRGPRPVPPPPARLCVRARPQGPAKVAADAGASAPRLAAEHEPRFPAQAVPPRRRRTAFAAARLVDRLVPALRNRQDPASGAARARLGGRGVPAGAGRCGAHRRPSRLGGRSASVLPHALSRRRHPGKGGQGIDGGFARAALAVPGHGRRGGPRAAAVGGWSVGSARARGPQT